jgi:hypothetical protein
MRMDHASSLTPRWIVFGTAVVYFALGSLMTAHFMHLKEVWADSHRVFQLEMYHAVPGKVPAVEERFRSCSRSHTKQRITVIRRPSSNLPTTIQGISGTSSPFTINMGSPSDLPTIVHLNVDSFTR